MPNLRLAALAACVCAAVCLPACGSDEHAGGLGSTTCAIPPCGTQPDAGIDAEASVDGADESAMETSVDVHQDAPWTGPTGSVTGIIFISNPPEFSVVPSTEQPLFYDATVRVLASSQELTIDYAAGQGFSSDGVPVGTWPVMADDPASSNGILPTVMAQTVVEGDVAWTLPSTSKNSFSIIYGALPSPLYVDPYRAQALLSFQQCATSGSARLSGVVVQAPAGSEGTIYDKQSGWEHEAPAGTGTNGIGIVVNLQANELPGEDISIDFTLAGESFTTAPFRIVRGAVSRVVVEVPCP